MMEREERDLRRSIKVYIVDDEPAIVEWLITYVEWGVYNCEVEGSSTEAEEALRFVSKHPVDLLITDISMRDMSGLALIQLVKKIKPNMSVIIISAYSKFEYVKEAIKFGVVNYLLKPININELNECLKIVEMNHAKLLNDFYSQDIVVFRNSILHELISGDMHAYKLEEQCELAGIFLEVPSYQIAVLDTKELERATCLSMVSQFNEGQSEKGYYCFFGSRMNLVLLFLGEHGGTLRIKKKIADVVRKEGIREPFYCIGNPLSSYSQIPESYRACNDFLDAKFVFSGHCNCMEDYPYEKYQSVFKSGFLQQFSNALYLEDRKNVIRMIKEQSHRCRTETERKKALICLAVLLIKNIRLNLPTQEMPIPENSLERQKTSEKMLEWIDKFYLNILDMQKGKSEGMESYVDRALLEVNNNYNDKNLSLQKIADICGITPAYMGQLFHSQTGEYFNDYLLRKRLDEVKVLLIKSNGGVGEIASAVGFSSQSHFNKMFRKVYGMSPMEYRNCIYMRNEDIL